jgi:hypothetical protein
MPDTIPPRCGAASPRGWAGDITRVTKTYERSNRQPHPRRPEDRNYWPLHRSLYRPVELPADIDPGRYLEFNQDVAAADADRVRHYSTSGMARRTTASLNGPSFCQISLIHYCAWVM